MNEKFKEEDKNNLKPLSFTMTQKQFNKLKKLKKEAYCKSMYILRFAAYYITNIDETEIKSYKDFDFNTSGGVPYKVDLPIDLYNKINEKSQVLGYSMSKLMRISLNDILNFMEE